jgi:NADH-quinone oxidoreductase subunit L
MYNLIGLVVLFPFLGFLANGLFGKKIKSEGLIGTIGSATVGLSFLLSAIIFFEMLQIGSEERFHIVEYFRWIAAGSLDISFAYQVDQL